VLLAQARQQRQQQPAPGRADDVADEQDRDRSAHDDWPMADDDLGPEPESTPAPLTAPAPLVVPRGVQLVLLLIGLLALWALARAAGTVLLLFLIAGVIALILNPLVKLVERRRLPHGAAVFAVYIGLLAALVGVGAVLANPVSNQVQSFQDDVPQLVEDATASLDDLQHWLDDKGIDIHIKDQGSTALQTIQSKLLRGSGDIVSFSRDLLRRLVETSFALILILVISIYMLVYAESIGNVVRAVMPRGAGPPDDDFPLQVQRAVFHYVRGQLLFSLIMGTTAAVALWIFGVVGIFPDGSRYALFFGAFFGLMELIPYIGPVLGAVPPILVALFDNPLSAIWVALLFLALQQLEGHVVAPQVFGHSLRINPLLIIFALLFGGELYGVIGAFLALPVAAILRETVIYLRRHVVLERWPAPQRSPPP